MNPTEHTVKTPSSKSGFVATLGALLAFPGSGVSSLERRGLKMMLASLCALGGVLALSSAPALAALTHPYLSQLTGFVNPTAVTVGPSGNLYVADQVREGGHSVVDRFSSSGTPLSFSHSGSYVEGSRLTGTPSGHFREGLDGVAVNNTTGSIYVSDSSRLVVDVFSSSGEYVSQLTGTPQSAPVSGRFGQPAGLAVDQATGELYVTDSFRSVVDVFSSSGEYVSQFGSGVLSEFWMESVAVNDLTGSAYVADSGPGVVYVFDSLGSLVPPEWHGALTPDGSFGNGSGRVYVGLDQSSGHVYVADTRHLVVDEFGSSASEEYVGQVTGTPAGPFTSPQAVAVDPSSGHLYVADASSEGVVDVFAAGVVVPDVTSEAPTAVTRTTALSHGTVNPDGLAVTSCEFEYRTEAESSFAKTAACSSAPGAGTKPVAVTASLSGLTQGTTYRYRLAATNANGTNRGSTLMFTTTSAVEALSTGPAEEIMPSSAKLTGSFSPNGTDTHYHFDYGTSTVYGSSSPEIDAGTGGTECKPPGGAKCSPVAASAVVSGLEANMTYHFRLVGVNTFGTTFGEDVMFTTPGPPRITGVSAEVNQTENAGQTNAKLTAQIIPGTLVPHEATYQFEYGETTAYGTSVPASPTAIGSGEEPVPVEANLSGLKIGTTYHFRVVTSNEFKTVESADQTFTTLPPVLIDSESVSQVTAESAMLATQLNPLGRDTTYRFEYGPSTAYGTSVPVPDGDAGSGTVDVPLSALVEGLTPGTTYHYRVVASNALGTVEGLDRVFVTQTGEAPGLLDGRAWEMVSPPNKRGASLAPMDPEGADIQAAESGGALAYVATAPITGESAGSRSLAFTQLLSTRDGTAWSTMEIATPHEEAEGLIVGNLSEYKLFSGDLSQGVVEPAGATPLAPALMGAHGERTPYRREPSGQYTPLVTASNTPLGTKFGGKEILPTAFQNGVEFESMTPDANSIVLHSEQPLTTEPAGGSNLYEWRDGVLKLVSILPDGTPADAVLGRGRGHLHPAVSRDGSRIIFTGGPVGTNEQNLFLRDLPRAESVQLDVPAAGVKPGNGTLQYQAASADGSRVFFTDDRRLTADSTASPEKPDLYVCDVSITAGHLACALRDLTANHNPGEVAAVQGYVIGVGDAGRFVYFVANGALAPGAVSGHCLVETAASKTAAGASCNLYVRDMVSESTRLVAVLSNRDLPDWEASTGEEGSSSGMTAEVSGSGRFLAFMSTRSLTGYDNRDAVSGQPVTEVYLFDAADGSLRCVSCDRSGARPSGVLEPENPPRLLADSAGVWRGMWLAGSIPGWTAVTLGSALYQSRYLSDSGRLFFNSTEGLVPSDGNGVGDVYEFEPTGVGGCSLVAGCVALMSGASSGQEAAFLDASVTGDDVFFLSGAKLAPADVDGALDVYDAHVCSAASLCPAGVVSVPPACSTADSCRAAPAAPPDLFGLPASATFNGSGNVGLSVKPPAKLLTRARELASALKACAKKPKRKRAACRATARRRFGPVHSARKHNTERGK